MRQAELRDGMVSLSGKCELPAMVINGRRCVDIRDITRAVWEETRGLFGENRLQAMTAVQLALFAGLRKGGVAIYCDGALWIPASESGE